MANKPTYAELESRIEAVTKFCGGTLPIEHALVGRDISVPSLNGD